MNAKLLVATTAVAALLASPALAQHRSDADAAAGGAVAGAVGGALIGGVVGGPVGAAVGGAVGAATGGTSGAALNPPPPEVITYVRRQEVPSVTVDQQIAVGAPLPHVVRLYPVPRYQAYDYAVVNDQPVIVDRRSRRIVQVIDEDGRASAPVGPRVVAVPPSEDTDYVVNWDVPSVRVEHDVVVGEPLPRTVELYPVPHHDRYDYAVVNQRRVFVDPNTRRVVRIIRTEDEDDGD